MTKKTLILGLPLARFGPNLVQKIFLWVLLLLDVIHCCELSLYTISRKTNEPNMRKWQKSLVSGPIFAPLVKIWAPKFFLQILTILDIRHCYKLSLYTISRKTNEPTL